MEKPKVIEWPDKAKICVTFIVPWEVWPENFATRESLQRHSSHTIPPANAVFKKTWPPSPSGNTAIASVSGG